jgi:hypothetical protein
MVVGDSVYHCECRVGGCLSAIREQALARALFPFLAEPPGYGMGAAFQSPEILHRLVSAWWFLGLYVVNAVFNCPFDAKYLLCVPDSWGRIGLA